MTTTSMFTDGDLVDVVIRGARYHRQSDHHADVYVDGVDEPFCVRLIDDNGEPLDTVTIGHHVPVVRPGEVWQARDNGALFLAAQDGDNPTRLIAADQRAYEPNLVVEHWGPIDCIASSAYVDPAPPAPSPHPDAVLISTLDVNFGDRILSDDLWHQVLGAADPAHEGPEYRRLFTDLAVTHGLLYRYADDVWVLRGGDNTPIYAEVRGPAEPEPAWLGFLRPADEPQPGDKVVTTEEPTIDDVAPAVLVDEPSTALPEPAR